MRKNIILSCVSLSAIIVLGQFGFFEALLMFFLAGIIPGTHYSIPSSGMFLIIITCISAIIAWLAGDTLFSLILDAINKIFPTSPKNAKKRLPKRRFGQI